MPQDVLVQAERWQIGMHAMQDRLALAPQLCQHMYTAQIWSCWSQVLPAEAATWTAQLLHPLSCAPAAAFPGPLVAAGWCQLHSGC